MRSRPIHTRDFLCGGALALVATTSPVMAQTGSPAGADVIHQSARHDFRVATGRRGPRVSLVHGLAAEWGDADRRATGPGQGRP